MQKESKDRGSINKSSLIDLKAELFRKQEEFKNQKLQNQNATYIRGKPSGDQNKKPNIFSKKNVGVAKRAEKDFEEKKEEEDVFERSKKSLENKARLYEKIACGTEVPDEDGSNLYLVDFQKKVIDDVMERKQKERQEKEDEERREAEEDRRLLSEPVTEAAHAGEEWVDFVDTLGRSRRCQRDDLARLQEADKKLQDTRQVKKEDISDPRRNKIEKEKILKTEPEKEGPIHYADVQHSEIRTHGVGFYQFDKEESVREEQLDQLKRLRDETKDERSKRERIKEKRKAAMAARLAKVKQRKREKLGLPIEEDEDNASSDEMIGPMPVEEQPKEPEPLTRDDSWRKTADLTREWDRGKQKVTERSENLWLEKQRKEREPEFAPPTFYYESNAKNLPVTEHKPVTKHKHIQSTQQLSDTTGASMLQSNDTSYADTKTLSSEDKSNKILADIILNKIRNIKNESDSPVTGDSATVNVDLREEQSSAYSYMPTVGQSLFEHKHPSDSFTGQVVDTNHPLQTDGSLISQAFTNTSATLPAFTAIPPPNVNVPPPVLNMPPPNLSCPPPNINIPPPNFNESPSSYNIPLPNTLFQTPNTSSSPNTQIVMNPPQSEETPQVNQGYYNANASVRDQVIQMQVHQTEANNLSQQVSNNSRPKISKMDIMDTRLIEREDD